MDPLYRYVRDQVQVQSLGRGHASEAALKGVLLQFADHANENRLAWPSIGRLVHVTQMSERTVQTAVHDLEQLGWILPTGRVTSGKARVPIYYVLASVVLIPNYPQRGAATAPLPGDEGAATAPRGGSGVQPLHSGGAATAPGRPIEAEDPTRARAARAQFGAGETPPAESPAAPAGAFGAPPTGNLELDAMLGAIERKFGAVTRAPRPDSRSDHTP